MKCIDFNIGFDIKTEQITILFLKTYFFKNCHEISNFEY